MGTNRSRATAWIKVLAATVALATAMVAAPPRAHAASFVVDSLIDSVDVTPGNGVCADAIGKCSLRAAIMETNALPGADVIIVPPGIHTLRLARGASDTDGTGDLDIRDHLTITGSNGNREGDPNATIIQAGDGYRMGVDKVMHINPDWTTPLNVTIEAVTVRYGTNMQSYSAPDGFTGGIDFEASGTGRLTIYNCVVADNYTHDGDGGGIVATNGQGKFGSPFLRVEKSIISGNHVNDGLGAGLAIGAGVPFLIKDSQIINNQAGLDDPEPEVRVAQGAGIYVFNEDSTAPASLYDGQYEITGTTFFGNRSWGDTAPDGAAIYTDQKLTITNSTFSSNTARGMGGAIVSSNENGDTLTLTNVTISGNVAHSHGGGLMVIHPNIGSATTVLNHVTIANNTADADGNSIGEGGGFIKTDGNGTVTFRNSIVANNTDTTSNNATTNYDNLKVVLDPVSHNNLIGTGYAGGLTGANGNLVNVADPGLMPLANNGGFTQTHGLRPGSPALDAGAAYGGQPTLDQRGLPRQNDAADSDTTNEPDIGAFEAHPMVEAIPAQTILEDTVLTLPFHVGDEDLTAGIDSITATSGNQTLVPNGNISITLSGSMRTMTITPGPNQFGTTTITVTAQDLHGGVNQVVTHSFLLTVVPRPDLTVNKTHADPWRQGDTGKTYTIKVQNVGPGPTLGAGNPFGVDPKVSVTDTLPAGLTATAMSGTGWSCSLGTLTCTRTDILGSGAFYPDITLTVNVAYDAGTPADNVLENTVAVSGAGDDSPFNNTRVDPTTITLTADLVVTKAHTGDFKQGEQNSYTLTVTNNGPGATDAPYQVVDTLPAGLSYAGSGGDAGWTCSEAGQTVTCNRSTVLNRSVSTTLAILVNVARDAATTAPHQVTNTASVSGGGELPQRAGNNGPVSDLTTITQMPDLSVTKTPNNPFRQGQLASYTIEVTNEGFADTTGTTTVTDTLPAGLAYTGFTDPDDAWDCNAIGQVVSCDSEAVVPAGGSFPTFTINVAVAGNAAASLTNTATVSGGGQIWTANDDGPAPTTVIPAPDLAITKTHAGNFTQGVVGETYTITVTNKGPGPTFGEVTVTDTLPPDLSPWGVSGAGWTCDPIVGQTVTCKRSDELAGNPGYPVSYPAITLTVNVATTAPPTVTNTASVSGGSELSTTLGDNTVSDPTNITQLPDLMVTKSDGDVSFQQGQTGATYTIEVSNIGTGASSGEITVTDTLPAGLTPISAIPDVADWTCTITGQTVECKRTTALNINTPNIITVTVDVARNAATSAPHELTNTVTLTGGSEPILRDGNNSDSETTPIVQMPDLEISKSEGTFRQNQSAAYTLTVSNTGFAATSGKVTVTDVLHPDLAFVSADGGLDWACSYDEGTRKVTCEYMEAVDAGGTFPAITLTVNVAATAPATLSNTASVAGGGQIWVDAKDTATVTDHPVIPMSDLRVVKSSTGPWTQGDVNRTYTIQVSNVGPGPTFGPVIVTDVLPPALSFVSASGGPDWGCTYDGATRTVTCTYTKEVAAGGTYPAITLTVDVTGTAPPTVTNTATVTGGNDSGATPADNTSTVNTAITQKPDLIIETFTASGDLRQGAAGQYSIVVKNEGTGLTTDPITLTVTSLPADLTPTGISGTGWVCDLATLQCTRATPLAAGLSTPAVEITFTIAGTAPASVTTEVEVGGGNDVDASNNSQSLPTAIKQVVLEFTGTLPGSVTAGDLVTFTGLVREDVGTPMSGVTVNLTADKGKFTDPDPDSATYTVTTGPDGTFTAQWQAIEAGAVTVSAAVPATNATDTHSLTVNHAAVATMAVNPSTTNTTAGTAMILTAELKDAFGNPVPNTAISVAAAAGTATLPDPATINTGADGKVIFNVTPTKAPLTTFTVSLGSFTEDVAVTVVPAAPADVSVVTDPAAILPERMVTLTGTVTDAYGNAVPAQSVNLTVTAGTLGTTNPLTTDANGQFTSTFTAPTAPGDVTLEASVGSAPLVKSFTLTVRNLVLSATVPTNMTAGSTLTISGTLTDGAANPVPGTAIDLTATVGSFNDTASVTTVTLTTGADGTFSQTYYNTVAGPVTISISTLGLAAQDYPVTVNPAAPASLTLVPDRTAMVAGESVNLTAAVTDTYGNPVPGIEVTVSAPNNTGTLTNATGTTDSSGEHVAAFLATRSGERTLTASAAGMMATATVNVSSAAPAALTLTTGGSAVIGQTVTISGSVLDAFDNGVGSVVVNLTTTGGTLSAATVTTNPAGHYQATLQVPSSPGKVTVTASVAAPALVKTAEINVFNRRPFRPRRTGWCWRDRTP